MTPMRAEKAISAREEGFLDAADTFTGNRYSVRCAQMPRRVKPPPWLIIENVAAGPGHNALNFTHHDHIIHSADLSARYYRPFLHNLNIITHMQWLMSRLKERLLTAASGALRASTRCPPSRFRRKCRFYYGFRQTCLLRFSIDERRQCLSCWPTECILHAALKYVPHRGLRDFSSFI